MIFRVVASMAQALIFQVQRFSLHDGPGIRTTVFFKGCPLRCRWCHNPEGQRPDPEIMVHPERCLACGACREACPNANGQAAAGGKGGDRSACRACGACVRACPAGARTLQGRWRETGGLFEEILRDRVFYEESQGGVTFSGGEPLAQGEALIALLRLCREAGVHTAVDTCGLAPRGDLLAVAGLAGLFLFDLKLAGPEAHREHTGEGNGAILENLEALIRAGARVRLRIPVVPAVNDNRAEMEALARLAARRAGIEEVELLPYHPTGAGKFARLGRAYELSGAEAPAGPRMEEWAEIFRRQGLPVRIGG
jgi:pyruvate formate lyase activating enzyme